MECPFPNFNDGIVEFGNGYVISSHTLQGMWLLIHTGIKVNLYQSKGTLTLLRKMQNPGSHNGPPMVDGCVVRLSSVWSVNQKSVRNMKSIKMVKRRQSESTFYIGTSTKGHMLSVIVMSGFILKYFLQNLKNSLVAKWTIGDVTLGRPVDSWVAFGDRATIFQQHCTDVCQAYHYRYQINK